MKDLILQLLDEEIEDSMFSYIRGGRNFNEIYTYSLLIEFDFYNNCMMDIRVTMESGDETETIVYADELSDEQVIKILQVAQLEEYANDMDVEI